MQNVSIDNKLDRVVQRVNYIYLLVYSIFVCSEFMNVTEFYDFHHVFLWKWVFELAIPAFWVVVSLLKIVQAYKASKKLSIAFVILLIGSFVLSKVKIGSHIDLFLIITLAISAYGIDFKKIARTFMISEGWAVALTIVCSLLGIIPNISVDEADGRHYILLGFGSHNVLMIAIFFISMSLIYVTANRQKKYIEALIILILTIIGYKLTASRTSTIVLLVGVIGLLFISLLQHKSVGKRGRKGKADNEVKSITPADDNRVANESSLINNEEKSIETADNHNLSNELKVIDKIKEVVVKIASAVMVAAPILGLMLTFAGTLIWNYLVRDLRIDYPIEDYALWGNTVTIRFADISINMATHYFKLPWEPQMVSELVAASGEKYNWILGGMCQTKFFDNIYASMFIVEGTLVFIGFMTWLCYRSAKAYKSQNLTLLLLFALIDLFNVFEGVAKMPVYTPFLLMPFSCWIMKKVAETDSRGKIVLADSKEKNVDSKDINVKLNGIIAESKNTIAESKNTIAESKNVIAESKNTIAASKNTILESNNIIDEETKNNRFTFITRLSETFVKHKMIWIVYIIIYALYTLATAFFVSRGYGIYPGYTKSWLLVAWIVSGAFSAALLINSVDSIEK